MSTWELGFLGIALMVVGAAYQRASMQAMDEHLFALLHRKLGVLPWIGLFRVAWPLGTTPVTLAGIAALSVVDWRKGVSALLAFLLAVGIERAIKVNLRRARPFAEHHEARMLQPVRPQDASFPSGDAMRVWFLAAVLVLALHLSAPLMLLLAALATVTSLGRIAMGVHYPLDVVAGCGLGLAAAGLWIAVADLATVL